MTTRTYADAIEALNSLQTNFAVIEAIRKSGGKANRDAIPQMVEWARRAGFDDLKVLDKLNIIHVTGTKGKGSTSAFTQSILSQYRNVDGSPVKNIGLYTSPHLKSVRERININGQPIIEEKFVKYFFELWDRLESTKSDLADFPDMGEGVKPVYFRYLTLLSFHVFMREGVDAAIYEVGIGGEHDSTNIIVTPTATGISSLGIDHTAILGNTIEEIAWHKAGIFKAGVPAFTVQQSEADKVMPVLEKRAAEKKASRLTVVPVHPQIPSIKLGLAGQFQQTNASLAVALAAEHLRHRGVDVGDVSHELPARIRAGLELVRYGGRCQTLPDPANKDLTWYIDGAHTKESMTEASKWYLTKIDEETAAGIKPTRVLLFNQQTRDAKALITILHKLVYEKGHGFDHVVFCTNVTWASGYSADLTSNNLSREQVDELVVQKALAEAWQQLDTTAERHVFPNIEEAVNFVRGLSGEVRGLVTGSLILAGGFLTVAE